MKVLLIVYFVQNLLSDSDGKGYFLFAAIGRTTIATTAVSPTPIVSFFIPAFSDLTGTEAYASSFVSQYTVGSAKNSSPLVSSRTSISS